MNGKIFHHLNFMSGILKLIGFGLLMPLSPWKERPCRAGNIIALSHSVPADTDATLVLWALIPDSG